MTALTEVDIPESVTTIGGSAFDGCIALATVNYGGSKSEWETITLGANNENLTDAEIKYAESDILSQGTCGENLTWSFDDSTGELTISGTGDMEDYASLSEVPWADLHSDIISVAIEDGVTSIGDCAFEECSNLTSITIPDSVTNIGANAFEGCTALTTVNYNGTQEEWDAITIGTGNDNLLAADIIKKE